MTVLSSSSTFLQCFGLISRLLPAIITSTFSGLRPPHVMTRCLILQRAEVCVTDSLVPTLVSADLWLGGSEDGTRSGMYDERRGAAGQDGRGKRAVYGSDATTLALRASSRPMRLFSLTANNAVTLDSLGVLFQPWEIPGSPAGVHTDRTTWRRDFGVWLRSQLDRYRRKRREREGVDVRSLMMRHGRTKA